MHRALQFLEGGHPYQCTAGDRLITVQPNGDLYPCRRMPIRTGNLLETPLVDLYQKSPLFRALRDRDRTSKGCQGCLFSGLCRGGLKCLSYAVTGDPFVADPGCWLASPRDVPVQVRTLRSLRTG
jgi:radical SAM protein with 4Fe4S-binding SPASM domain